MARRAARRFSLVSDGRRFGDPGFYFTIEAEPGTVYARYVRTMKERLSLHAEDGRITASHRFAVFGLQFLELRYDIVRKAVEARKGATAGGGP